MVGGDTAVWSSWWVFLDSTTFLLSPDQNSCGLEIRDFSECEEVMEGGKDGRMEGGREIK